ncbi:molybdopterin oxidoreductase, partial [Saccharopolyspora karakumensis]
WSSAGRFHHGQSQLHRFLNTLGGYVSGLGDYSYGASGVLLQHVVGRADDLMADATTWESVAEHTELFVAFGGVSEKNSAVGPGGVGRHTTREAITRARRRGCEFVSISPIADDTFAEAGAQWLSPRPGTDTALMLALAYVLECENLVDREFLRTRCVGYPEFARYVRGDADGVPKSPEWAAGVCELTVDTIVALARRMARSRTLINVSWSLQRQQHGEQTVWAGLTLAAMLGQIGLPGGGFQHGYGSTSDIGLPRRVASPPALPQGKNLAPSAIPVARIADALLHPGSEIDYNGSTIRLPEIDLIYWVGGNPFHHHQDLARLRQAFRKPSTVVVHEQFWTSTARHADVVLPATMSIERDDFGAGRNDPDFFPMPALTRPAGSARDDYAIFWALAERLGVGESFSEGRSVLEWLEHLYTGWRGRLAEMGCAVPTFEEFWTSERIAIPVPDPGQVLLSAFRENPDAAPVPTSSGRIEIFSDTIASFGYDDCPGHPVWRRPQEWPEPGEQYPLLLISNQPRTRLHSQLDVGETSVRSKIGGREPARMHPADAAARGLEAGDIIRIVNARGSCLAGLITTETMRPGIVQLSTGAWYDPDPADPSFCRHGNPNVLTPDVPSSRLSQATTAQHAAVEVEKWTGPVPELVVD